MRQGREGHLDSGPQAKTDCFFSAWRIKGLPLCLASLIGANPWAQPEPVATTSPTTAPSVSGSAVSALAGRTIEGVRVLGNQTVSTAIILNLVRTREGGKLDPSTVEEDYQRIYG